MQTLHFAYAVQNPDLSAFAGHKPSTVMGMQKKTALGAFAWPFRCYNCKINFTQLYRGMGHVGRALRLSSRQLSPAEHDCAGDPSGS